MLTCHKATGAARQAEKATSSRSSAMRASDFQGCMSHFTIQAGELQRPQAMVWRAKYIYNCPVSDKTEYVILDSAEHASCWSLALSAAALRDHAEFGTLTKQAYVHLQIRHVTGVILEPSVIGFGSAWAPIRASWLSDWSLRISDWGLAVVGFAATGFGPAFSDWRLAQSPCLRKPLSASSKLAHTRHLC